MDNFTKHVKPIQRMFSHPASVAAVGYVNRKTFYIRRSFPTFNFSFILNGTGKYITKGKEWEVNAPCVITQWPDVYVEYGPDSYWEELYLIYPAQSTRYFKKKNIINETKPVWPINDFRKVKTYLSEVIEITNDADALGNADRLDMIAELLVIESLIGEKFSYHDEKEKKIREIQAHIESNYTEDYDFDELALDNRMSPSDFRRHWRKYVGTPPARYLVEQRILSACRMLAETSFPVASVADKLGFNDPLYFSRKFKQFTGQSPSHYRELYSSYITLDE